MSLIISVVVDRSLFYERNIKTQNNQFKSLPSLNFTQKANRRRKDKLNSRRRR